MEVDKNWIKVTTQFEEQFGPELEMEGILFLVGIQVLGQGPKKFNKNQKVDLMHIAICTLLEPYGYYIPNGLDEEGWPHWDRNKKLPFLSNTEQEKLIKQSIISAYLTEPA